MKEERYERWSIGLFIVFSDRNEEITVLIPIAGEFKLFGREDKNNKPKSYVLFWSITFGFNIELMSCIFEKIIIEFMYNSIFEKYDKLER